MAIKWLHEVEIGQRVLPLRHPSPVLGPRPMVGPRRACGRAKGTRLRVTRCPAGFRGSIPWPNC